MKLKTLKIALVFILALSLAPMSVYGFEEDLKLNHFKFYKSPTGIHDFKIGLRGQFDKKVMDHHVRGMIYFGNPVSKNGGKIYDKHAHLSMYWIQLLEEYKEPDRVVYGRNQFGKFEMVIGQPDAMLAPAQKIEKGLEFPRGLNHFKCYRVLKSSGQSIPKSVKLKDQFDKEAVQFHFGWPRMFCTPVIKYRNGKPEEDKLGKGHLVIYSFQPVSYPMPKFVYVVDQFQKAKLPHLYAVMLGVPTLKDDWKPLK
ncbi:MAG: hypothetical protein GY859_30685 [Desulfobacterales bacterium]|nr:hypothetical protein [Desulfobacterales bacterium]